MYGTLEDKRRHQRNSNIGIASAVILFFGSLGIVVLAPSMNDSVATPVMSAFIGLRIASTVLWFWGLAEYAKSKGHSGWNSLWGLLSILGLLVLLAKKDQFLINPPDTGGFYPRSGQTF